MIQFLEDMMRRFCAYELEFKDSDGFTHYCCTLIPALELAYKTSVHSSTVQTPAILEKGWNPRLPAVKTTNNHPPNGCCNIFMPNYALLAISSFHWPFMASGHILPSLALLANSPPHQPPENYPCFWAWVVFSSRGLWPL
ncbi:hypothetical protein O181_054362 [Austropuccinia psidii MF-1]|uniref:Uncharacterized protein n=1 Tax=Austropuccinia psidii MF-1 TaxID=1389203 RepID=A0A9Q3HSG3_9BASI|nr:hypothetical protein [Austropuccinia psidii MF-1]